MNSEGKVIQSHGHRQSMQRNMNLLPGLSTVGELSVWHFKLLFEEPSGCSSLQSSVDYCLHGCTKYKSSKV